MQQLKLSMIPMDIKISLVNQVKMLLKGKTTSLRDPGMEEL